MVHRMEKHKDGNTRVDPPPQMKALGTWNPRSIDYVPLQPFILFRSFCIFLGHGDNYLVQLTELLGYDR